MVLLVVVEIEVETREANLGPIEEAVVPLEDDVATLPVEVEEGPQDDQKTCYYKTSNTCCQCRPAVYYTLTKTQ